MVFRNIADYETRVCNLTKGDLIEDPWGQRYVFLGFEMARGRTRRPCTLKIFLYDIDRQDHILSYAEWSVHHEQNYPDGQEVISYKLVKA